MSDIIKRYTTELLEAARNGKITGISSYGTYKIAGIDIDGVTLWENFHEIFSFWDKFTPYVHINTSELKELYVSLDDGLMYRTEYLCKPLHSKLTDSDIEDTANCIIKDAVYHIGVSVFVDENAEEDDETEIVRSFICNDNSIWEKWYNQPVFNISEWEERREEILIELREEVTQWESKNISEEIVKYTKMAYYAYEPDEYYYYEDFVCLCGYIDGTLSECEPPTERVTSVLYDELEQYFGLKNLSNNSKSES